MPARKAAKQLEEEALTKRTMMNIFQAVMLATAVLCLGLFSTTASAQTKKPNILIIMGDDIGIWNISAYNTRA